jgi:hypothetical protein
MFLKKSPISGCKLADVEITVKKGIALFRTYWAVGKTAMKFSINEMQTKTNKKGAYTVSISISP